MQIVGVRLMQTQKNKLFQKKADEKILVVKRKKLFPNGSFNGLRPINVAEYHNIIETYKEFLWRSTMEHDPSYKQIIPYLIFTHENKYFVMQRKENASEGRLQNKYSLGIGGHIRQEDVNGACTIVDWARREFEEEVAYNGSFTIAPLGLLNDERDSVGQVHTGFVFLLTGDSPTISIKDEHKAGALYTLDECASLYSRMESWSNLVFDYLRSTSHITRKSSNDNCCARKQSCSSDS